MKTNNEKRNELTENMLKDVSGGIAIEVDGDIESLRFSGKSVPLPPAKSKKCEQEK